MWQRLCRRILAPGLVIAILLSAAWREDRSHPLDFWSHSEPAGDYVNICLAHALNIDFWVSQTPLINGRTVNDNNSLHPGLPLQATSWAAYRIPTLGKSADVAERCESVFVDPSSFWVVLRLAAIALGLVGSILLVRAASTYGFLYSIAVGLVYYCYEPAWKYTICMLGNESFALPLSLAVAWFASRSLNPSEGGAALKWYFGWGSLCALCWLNKLNYIAWTVAALPAFAAYYFALRPPIRQMGSRLAAFGCGFIVAAYALATLFLGSGGLSRILHLHFAVLTHSGNYGIGPAGAVSLSAVRNALFSLSAYWPFLGLSAGICALGLGVVVSTARSGWPRSGNAAYLIYLLCAAGLFLAATLKHYGSHYLIAGVPAISLLLLAIGGHVGAVMRVALSLAVCLGLIHSYRRFWILEDTNFRREMEMKTSLQAVEDLPGRDRGGVMWTYRLPNRRFVMELIQYLAGVPEVAAVIDEKFPTPDSVYFLWNPDVRVGAETRPFDKAKWRYAVFQRDYYGYLLTGSQASAKEYFERHCKRIIDEPMTIVFERTAE